MRKIPPIRYLVIGAFAAVIAAIPAYSRSSSPRSLDATTISESPAATPYWTDRGRLTFGFQMAYGLENNIPHNISHINMVLGEPRIGFIAWDSPYTRLPIKRFEVLGEGILGGSFHPGGEILGISLLLRLGFRPKGRIVPYLDVGSGPVHTTISTNAPELTGGTQFLSQVGVGLQYFVKPQRAMTFEYHYFHMSNGGIQQPNPGFNGGMVTIGFCWLHGPHPLAIASDVRRLHFPRFW